MRPRDGGTINDDTVIAVQGVFHAATYDIVRAIDIGVQKEGAGNNCHNKPGETEEILEQRMFLEKLWFHEAIIAFFKLNLKFLL